MKMFKQYTNIRNFLSRFTIFQLGKLHIRLHQILGKDATNLVHTHPFNYISIVYRGGYLESVRSPDGSLVIKEHTAPAIIVRSHKVAHRIVDVLPNTKTLFCAYGQYGWKATPISPPDLSLDGVYFVKRTPTYSGNVWVKRKNGVWFYTCTSKSRRIF